MYTYAEEYVPVGAVSQRIGCSGNTVKRWIKEGKLEAIRPGGEGGRYFVKTESVDKLIASSSQ